MEVLIVISILAIASGIVAISINKAIVEQRFRSEVGLIVDEMRLAQDLMLILGTDVHLHFAEAKSGEGIQYWLELETNVSPHVQRELLRKRKELKTIKGVFLEDKLLWEIKESHIDVKFLSNGAVMSEGIMRLATSSDENVPKGTLESFICLAGYPNPIISSRTKEEAEASCYHFEEGLDDRLTKDTVSKLPERLKKVESQENTPTKDKDKDDKKNKDNQNPSGGK
jgi:hypothetical protein